MEQVLINSKLAKHEFLEFPLLGEVNILSLNARWDPGTVQIVYVDSVCRSVCKSQNPWFFKSSLQIMRQFMGHEVMSLPSGHRKLGMVLNIFFRALERHPWLEIQKWKINIKAVAGCWSKQWVYISRYSWRIRSRARSLFPQIFYHSGKKSKIISTITS